MYSVVIIVVVKFIQHGLWYDDSVFLPVSHKHIGNICEKKPKKQRAKKCIKFRNNFSYYFVLHDYSIINTKKNANKIKCTQIY